jgi:apolipoprotein N-acyltransferase
VLVPWVGEFRSNQIGVFTGSAIILVIAYFTIRWIGAERPNQLLLVGLIWLLLTVAFELLFGRFVLGMPWERVAADYNVLQGGLMPVGLMVLFFSPRIAAKLRVQKVCV